MRIDVLVFEGCPNGDLSWELAKRVAKEECPLAELRLVDVPDAESAQAHRFLGSPSIQVDGEDIELGRLADEGFSHSCRVYRTESGMTGAVPERLLRDALKRHALRLQS